jgi:UDP-glucose 4-epimerase
MVNLQDKKVLVTGGAGFIGSHLVERLLNEYYNVVVLDNFSNGRIDNLESNLHNKRLQVIHADITNYIEIEPYFKHVSWVFHLAALADIVPSIQYPLKYHASNVDGTINVLEASRKNEVKRFIYAASSSCYGMVHQIPTSENAQIQLMYPYAVTKYVGEQYSLQWNKIYHLPVVSLRLFNVYGPRSRTTGAYGAVFGVFLSQKYHHKPFTVVGDGTQTRDFTFVTDIVDGFLQAAASYIEGEVINLGNGNTYSINRLIELIGGGEVIHIPKRPGEPDCTFADISKARKLLDYNPKVSFKEGVKIMLQNIEYWKNAPLWDESSISEATKDWFIYLSDQS